MLASWRSSTPPCCASLLLGALFGFFFHLANGVRHLVWDCGVGFEKAHARASAWLVLVVAVALTVLCAYAAWQRMGVMQ